VGKRQGTHATLNRRRVSGSTRKLYKQKGVGRARHGSTNAPNFVGGGIAFGPNPRDYSYKLSKKFRRSALRSALSEKIAQGGVKVINAFEVAAPKTKTALATLLKLGTDRALVVDLDNEKLSLSVRNLERAKFADLTGVNVYTVLRYDSVVITVQALKALDGVLSK
jgi:large subunit ribosomal protein L4